MAEGCLAVALGQGQARKVKLNIVADFRVIGDRFGEQAARLGEPALNEEGVAEQVAGALFHLPVAGVVQEALKLVRRQGGAALREPRRAFLQRRLGPGFRHRAENEPQREKQAGYFGQVTQDFFR